MAAQGRVLIVADGGLAGLVACACAAEGLGLDLERAWVACWSAGDANDPLRLAACRTQAERLGLESADLPQTLSGQPAEREALQLLLAAQTARRLHAERLLWAAHAGADDDQPPDVERMAAMVDRALLAGRLASVDDPPNPAAPVEIELPWLDLTDRQLAELAVDLAAPVETCWWWGPGQTGRGEAGREYRRWAERLKRSGPEVVA